MTFFACKAFAVQIAASRSISAIAILHPSSANRKAKAFPIPLPPPVIFLYKKKR